MSQNIEIERRLAAVLAADVAGFSRLTEADEVGTMRMLAAQRAILVEAISRHRGRIANSAGDSVLAEFPSAVNAVQCAVEAQQALRDATAGVADDKRVLFRIGIHVGDVMVRGGDLLGNGVNVAARLEALADPGGIVISAATHEQVKKILPLAYTDLGAQRVKNIEEPVRAFAIGAAATSPASMFVDPDRPLPLPEKPSIAVLPFQNMSGDPEQEYFADGIVEDITTALSRFKLLFVIARNSSFTYKGKAIDIKQVGRELGVRYVLEGSVRKAGSRVRITAQLIDATTGLHLWADKFEGSSDDIFDLQDRVTSDVVGVIAPKIEQAEIERASKKATTNLDAYDFYLRGIASHDRWTREANEDALRMFAHAIELDPYFAAAMARKCSCYTQRSQQRWMADANAEVAEAVVLARRALDIEREDATVLTWCAFTLASLVSELEVAVPLLERAIDLNPNSALAHQMSGFVQIWLGHPEVAIDHFVEARRLNPIDSLSFTTSLGLACARFFAGRDQDALIAAERALADNPKHVPLLRYCSAILALCGQIEKARQIRAGQLARLPSQKRQRQPGPNADIGRNMMLQ